MATVIIPSVTNPGVSFTRNSCTILRNICDHFSGCNRHLIPYKEFQALYQEVDPKGDSKIRMLFPLYRKAGCIYPDEGGSVRFENGSFLTQLGESFYKISCLYYDALDRAKLISKENRGEADVIIHEARSLYAGIAKTLFSNLVESEDVYKHLQTFVRTYSPVTKDEISLLLYALEKTSTIRGSVVRCDYNSEEVNQLVVDYRAGNVRLRQENANNAVQYFMAVMKTLLVVDVSSSGYTLAEECAIF